MAHRIHRVEVTHRVSQQAHCPACSAFWWLAAGEHDQLGFDFPGELLHLQETFSDVVKTDKTGLSKTAHTRWMISAFANFLPGSTIFRLA